MIIVIIVILIMIIMNIKYTNITYITKYNEIDLNKYSRFPKFHRAFFGPRPWHIEIRHRVNKNIHNQFVRI